MDPGRVPASTEVQGVPEGAGPAAPVAAPASQFTLLVMHPCGGPDEAAPEGVLRPTPAPAPAPAQAPTPTPTPAAATTPAPAPAAASRPGAYPCEVAGDAEDEAGEDEADLLDTSDPPGGGESTASLEDLEDEEAHSGGEGAGGGPRRRGSGGGNVSKTCTYEGCSETTSQVAKQRKPWMCKKHRNKMYKDKYKKKKSDQALNCGGAAAAGSAGNVKLEVLHLAGILWSGRWKKKTHSWCKPYFWGQPNCSQRG